jgi:hypothetical protein
MKMEPGFPVEMQPRITLRPKHGMRMILERRSVSSPAPRQQTETDRTT